MNMGPREDHSRHSLRAHIRGSAESTPLCVRNRACAETAPAHTAVRAESAAYGYPLGSPREGLGE